MKIYDHYVETYRINPPIGGNISWGAKARVKKTGTGRSDDIITLNEHIGTTEREAHQKAEAEAKQWINAKVSSST